MRGARGAQRVVQEGARGGGQRGHAEKGCEGRKGGRAGGGARVSVCIRAVRLPRQERSLVRGGAAARMVASAAPLAPGEVAAPRRSEGSTRLHGRSQTCTRM